MKYSYQEKKKPGILIIGPTPPPYHGVSVLTDMLLRSSLNEYFSVYHVEMSDRRGLEHVGKPDVKDLFLFIMQWIKVCSIFFLNKPVFVYLAISQNTVAFLRDSLFLLTAYATGTKAIIHLHGGNFRTWYSNNSRIFRKFAKTLLKKVDGAIVLGESLKYNFEPFVDKAKIYVVPNGIQVLNNNSALYKVSCLKNSHSIRRRILHLSTLMRRKGAIAFLEAIPSVLEKRQDVEFILAGPWIYKEDKQWAIDFIKKTSIEKYVTFAGEVIGEAKFALFCTCDLFVFPGIQQEGQPLVVIEAMASGIPVLFTNRGCLRETVNEGEAGMEIAINDPLDLASKILWMFDNPIEMKKMGLSGKRRYENNYTLAHCSKRIIDVLSRIAEERP